VKIVTIIGARPQFIKSATVTRAIEHHNLGGGIPEIEEILVHTGQHYDYDMSQVFFHQLEIRQPQYNLGVGSGSHGEMTGRMLAGIESVLMKEKPDSVIVYGDTNSTLAGALAATKLDIPVAHVEAGLRSFNRRMPEEINRLLTDHMATLLFCPTDASVMNLEREGITHGVHKVGDVMYDAFLSYENLAKETSTILRDLDVKPQRYCLATIHRQENTDESDRLLSIMRAFNEIAGPDCPFIIPLHPRTRKALRKHEALSNGNPHVRIIPPVSYLDLIALETDACVIFTDSGGVQKEAFFAQVPCVTLRDETEWVETVTAGSNRLAGADTHTIVQAFHEATFSTENEHPRFYGNGQASQLVLEHLVAGAL
jgi:UDP-GlcNAc3NAcA epimerase